MAGGNHDEAGKVAGHGPGHDAGHDAKPRDAAQAAPGAGAGVDWGPLAESMVLGMEPSLGADPAAWATWLARQDPPLRSAIITKLHTHKGNFFVFQVESQMRIANAPKLPDERPLSSAEIGFLFPTYMTSINYGSVRLKFDTLLTKGGYGRTVGNAIHMPESCRGPSGELTTGHEGGLELLAHEIGHVWQYQHSGLVYIPDALLAQLAGKMVGHDAYEWQGLAKRKVPFEEWNPEAQAEMGAAYNIALHKLMALGKGDRPDPGDLETIQLATPYVGKLMAGQARRTNSPTETGAKILVGPVGGFIIDELLGD